MSLMQRSLPPACTFHFLKDVEFETALQLQRRLVYEAGEQTGESIVVLVCEHPPLITIGRGGSRSDIRLDAEALARHRLDIRYVARGGGTLLHGPGQFCVYVVAPLDRLGWKAGEFLRRMRAGFSTLLAELSIPTKSAPRRHDLIGRTGALVTFGVAIQNGISFHGAYLKVVTDRAPIDYIDAIPAGAPGREGKRVLSSLMAERGRVILASTVRALLIPHLTAAFGAAESHLLTGHPWLMNKPARTQA